MRFAAAFLVLTAFAAPAGASSITAQAGEWPRGASQNPASQNAEWYVELNGVVQGPLTLSQVAALLKAGEITEQTRVRQASDRELRPLAETPGLGAAVIEARLEKPRGWPKPHPRDDVRFAALR